MAAACAAITPQQAASVLLKRRAARKSLLEYILYTSPYYLQSYFSRSVCEQLDRFIADVQASVRPVLILSAPVQHGKSEIVSRKLPAYLLGKFPDWRIAAASYSSTLSDSMSLDVRRNLASREHQELFPISEQRRNFTVNRNGELSSPTGTGSYISDGVGGGFTGRSADIFIIDDPIKNSEEALSQTTKEKIWSWYQSTSKTRMSKDSGMIIMATRWAMDDLTGRVIESVGGTGRLRCLTYPAINEPDEIGYDPELPRGPLVPELHPIEQLREVKAETSEYFWAALYQQKPQPLGGNVFKESGVQHYAPKDLPLRFDKVINSWDCTFKETDGTDFVVGQAWGKAGANSYLLDQIRARMSFSATVESVIALRQRWPQTSEVLIEDKANGPAVIDVLKAQVPGLIAVEPDGSKLARAHAVTWVWEAKNVWTPYPQITPWMRAFLNEILFFPAAANDDQVDAMTQALRRLYPLYGRLNISQAAIDKAMGRMA